jgi:hypothetical protein
MAALAGQTFAFAPGAEAAPPLDLSLDEIIKLRKKDSKKLAGKGAAKGAAAAVRACLAARRGCV